jgi:CO dehydrogenase/acetyl-CoA synthase alpha subunit
MSRSRKDIYNRDIKVGDIIVGLGSYSMLATAMVTGFTNTGMARVLKLHKHDNGRWSCYSDTFRMNENMLTDYRNVPKKGMDKLIEVARSKGYIDTPEES